MSRLEHMWVWVGGALFVLSLGYAAWWYAVALDRTIPFNGWRPIAVNAVIFSAFALHHSIFARPMVKRVLSRYVPDRLLRSVYVWAASLLLIAVCRSWQPVGGEVYRISGWARTANVTVQLAGFFFIALSVRAIDALELAGIKRESAGDLQARGPYALVRHPLYLGWMMIVFGAAHMTGDRLAFATITSLYLFVAMPWEERTIEDAFGASYRQYKSRVRWRVLPYIY